MRRFALLCLTLSVTMACKARPQEVAPTPASSLIATPGPVAPTAEKKNAPPSSEAFTLQGEFFELALPAGWQAHPHPDDIAIGAVNPTGPYELIVASQTVDTDKATAAGLSFDSVLRQLAEVRRTELAQRTSTGREVDPLQLEAVEEMPVITFGAQLSKAPLAGATAFCALIGVPGTRAGTTSKRPVLVFSLYDYRGSPIKDVERLAHALLGPLKIKEYERGK